MKTENLEVMPAKHAPSVFPRLLVSSLLIALAAAAPCRGASPSPGMAPTTQTQSFFRRILGGFSSARPAEQNALMNQPVPLFKLRGPELVARVRADMNALNAIRAGLLADVDRLRANPISLSGDLDESRSAVRQAWCAVCDRCLGLEALARYYDDFYRVGRESRAEVFLVRRAAYLAACRGALEFDAAIKNSALTTALDEPVPELGLPPGFYTRLVDHYRGGAAGELAALLAIDREISGARSSATRVTAAADARAIAALGHVPGQSFTRDAALNLLRREGRPDFFTMPPAVADEPQAIPDDRAARARQRTECLLGHLDPGDILLIRKEGRLSAMGLPGYWTRAALYAGTAAERKGYFNESSVKSWVIGRGQDDFEGLLRAADPSAYASSLSPRREGEPLRVVGTLAGGIGFTELESVAESGSIAVLRPRLSKLAKAEALLRAFACHSQNTPLADADLIRIAYAPDAAGQGLGRVETPNELARLFDEGLSTPGQQLDFVHFIDGPMLDAGAAEFRESWRRPKWRLQVESALPPPPTAPAPAHKSLAWEIFRPAP